MSTRQPSSARGRSRRDRNPPSGTASRRLAIEAMTRIESDGAYANLVLPELLSESDLVDRDRRFVTQVVYGTTRMKRACDHLVDRFLLGDADPKVRAALRIGAYQLVFLETPPHAAVAATVGALSGPGRSVVNAVLRRVSDAPVEFPDDATRLSYPDWIVQRLAHDLGADDAEDAMVAMNRAAVTSTRDDGYIQDPASQLVIEAVAAEPGHVVVDTCAAPGGKATGLAARGALVVAGDRRASRTRLVMANASRTGHPVQTVVADGRQPPVRPGSADRVLVDAPCSGFGSLRRRPDARWRIDDEAPGRLGRLQVELVVSGLDLLRPGGILTYSVCTFGDDEGAAVIAEAIDRAAEADLLVDRLEPPSEPWQARNGMAVLVPADTDGMMLAQLRRRF